MSPLRHPVSALAAAVLFLSMPVAPARASETLDVDDLVRLARAGAGDVLLEELLAERGFEDDLSVEAILELKRAGVSDAVVAGLLAESRPGGPVGGVTYREEDGVLVVEGRGDPSVAPAPDPPPSVATDLTAASPAPPAPTVVVVEAGPSAAPEPRRDANANPFPLGSSHGWSGSTVFVPARFGEPASSFGRTHVTLGPGWGPACGAVPPLVRPGVRFPGPTSSLAGGASGRTIPVRTSRGIIRLPN